MEVISAIHPFVMESIESFDLSAHYQLWNQLMFLTNFHFIMIGCWMIGDYGMKKANTGASVFYQCVYEFTY